jgi:hypothetical protein
VFGSGSQIGTGHYVVYKGIDTSVNITGLNSGTVYHFAIYEYNTLNKCYHLTELVGNLTTTAPTITLSSPQARSLLRCPDTLRLGHEIVLVETIFAL